MSTTKFEILSRQPKVTPLLNRRFMKGRSDMRVQPNASFDFERLLKAYIKGIIFPLFLHLLYVFLLPSASFSSLVVFVLFGQPFPFDILPFYSLVISINLGTSSAYLFYVSFW